MTLPRGKKVKQRLEQWWQRIAGLVMNKFFNLAHASDALIGTRGFKKLVTDNGSYLAITADAKNFFVIVGTKDAPLDTTGIRFHPNAADQSKSDYETISFQVEGAPKDALQALDDRFKLFLQQNAKQIFDISNQQEAAAAIQYVPLCYQPDLSQPALLTAKIGKDIQVVDESDDRNIIASRVYGDLEKSVLPGAKVRAVLRISSFYFKTKYEVKCKVEAMNVQVLEQGVDAADFDYYGD